MKKVSQRFVNWKNTMFLAASLFATTLTFNACSEDDPVDIPPVNQVEKVSYTAGANAIEINKLISDVKKNIKNPRKDIESATINGNIGVKESDFEMLRGIGEIKILLGDRFIFNGKVYPLGQIFLAFSEWEKWGKLNLSKSQYDNSIFVIQEEEKNLFNEQEVKIDERFMGLRRVNSAEYGIDGAILKTLNPDTIIHRINGADAEKLLKFLNYPGARKVIKTVLTDGKQPAWSNMNNEIIGMMEFPSVPDVAGVTDKSIYKCMEDQIVCEYVEWEGKPKGEKPFILTESACDTLRGNQLLPKLRASHRMAGKKDFTRPVIKSDGQRVYYYGPNTTEYKNPAGLPGGFINGSATQIPTKSRAMIYKGEFYNISFRTLFRATSVSMDSDPAYNQINLVLGDASKTLVVLTPQDTYKLSGDSWDAVIIKFAEMLKENRIEVPKENINANDLIFVSITDLYEKMKNTDKVWGYDGR